MDKIGQGLHFHVYDHGSHVVKVPTNVAQIRRHLVRASPGRLLRPAQLAEEVDEIVEVRHRMLMALQWRPVEPELLGGLRIREGRIRQEKLVPFRDALDLHPQPRVLLDAFVAAVMGAWRHGFTPYRIDPLSDYGVNERLAVTMMDFQRITFDRAAAVRLLTEHAWERDAALADGLGPDHHAYLVDRMRVRLTTRMLDVLWPEGHHLTPVPLDRGRAAQPVPEATEAA